MEYSENKRIYHTLSYRLHGQSPPVSWATRRLYLPPIHLPKICQDDFTTKPVVRRPAFNFTAIAFVQSSYRTLFSLQKEKRRTINVRRPEFSFYSDLSFLI